MKVFETLLFLNAGLPNLGFVQESEAPTVLLPGSQIQGVFADGVETFFGIPYAESPAGLDRLKRPVRRTRPLGEFDATTATPACPQGHFKATESDRPWDWERRSLGVVNAADMPMRWYADPAVVTSEDCLTITVQRPAGTKAGDNLPVLFMIHGYGFVMGASSIYNATSFINFGVNNKQPFIFVTANYRMGAWGFLPGKQVMANKTTNLGLYDQRMSMEWTSDYIAAFGGDPAKITLWGHSAGGVSVFDHLVINGGNASYNDGQLFRGAVMSSGSLIPADYPNSPKCQEVYDAVVEAAGCQRKQDTLQCLRELSSAEFERATGAIPGINAVETMRLLYIPRPDGDLIRHSPEKLVNSNMFLAVPMILGNQEDEGTIFAQAQSSVNSGARLNHYLRRHYFRNAKGVHMRDFVKTYSKKPLDGSPYRTGNDFEEWLGKKRLASVIGDVLFILPRRLALAFVAASQPLLPLWGYQSSFNYRNGASSAFGTSHGSFEAAVFDTGDYNSPYSTNSTRAYMINFVYNLDPNKGAAGVEFWPKWTIDEPRLLWLNSSNNAHLSDTYRNRSYKYMKRELDLFRF
ncbi:hypothetical protein Trco_001269 [Trichoderma cornu-damae]|uniref:Carboxylic ester hydrolase n=1 Tax=Trichoderma cornu-damae TaxID=654480 RepID=A0A9P8QU10_9HYPO|nr:hypothetical protein Trco_001269 [Trichoderma cornu-damae]